MLIGRIEEIEDLTETRILQYDHVLSQCLDEAYEAFFSIIPRIGVNFFIVGFQGLDDT